MCGDVRSDRREAQLGFNASLTRIAPDEGIELVDTTSISVDDAAERVVAWMHRALSKFRPSTSCGDERLGTLE